LVDFKKVYSDWDSVFAQKGWGTIYLANHDQPRMVSRWGNDEPAYRETSSKMLTTFLLSMRGTPYYYFGDELGMTNLRLTKKEDFRDIEIMAEFGKIENAKGNLQAFIDEQAKYGGGRDNGRSPMQWNSGTNAGFTTGIPWLKVNDNKTEVNVEAAEKNVNSTLHYFRKMTKLRKEHKDVLVYGKYTLLDVNNPDVYAYTRESGNGKVLVLLSFRKTGGVFNLGNMQLGEEWINNLTPLKVVDGKVTLAPYQACVVKVSQR
jgi:oligo-1,6-glucosidase